MQRDRIQWTESLGKAKVVKYLGFFQLGAGLRGGLTAWVAEHLEGSPWSCLIHGGHIFVMFKPRQGKAIDFECLGLHGTGKEASGGRALGVASARA